MAGLLVALVSAVVYAVGLIIEQGALHRSESLSVRRPLRLARILISNPRWLGGCALAAIGSVGLIVALGLAPVSVVQPSFASGIAAILLLRAAMAGGPRAITRGEWVALGLMPLALGLLGFSLGGENEVGTSANLPALVGLSLGTVAVCVAAVAWRGAGPAISAVALAIAAGLSQGVAGLQGKGMGGALADEGVVEAIPVVLTSPFPYLYVVGWAVGIVLFQTSLQRSRASVTAPVSNVVGNLFVVTLGTIIYAEPLPTDPIDLLLRIGGIAMSLAVIVLVRSDVASVEADTAQLRARIGPDKNGTT